MANLVICTECDGFSPAGGKRCLHCGKATTPQGARGRPWFRAALTLAGGASLSMTLAACYGSPCAGDGADCYYSGDMGISEFCSEPGRDLDMDGHCLEFDCDEDNPDINSSAADEVGDNIDQNCDNVDGVAMPEMNQDTDGGA